MINYCEYRNIKLVNLPENQAINKIVRIKKKDYKLIL